MTTFVKLSGVVRFLDSVFHKEEKLVKKKDLKRLG